MGTYTESTSNAGFISRTETISKMTDVHEGRIGAYHLAHQKTLDMAVESKLDKPMSRSQRKQTSDTPENRHLLNYLQREASKRAALMVEAAQRNDPQDLGLAGMELKSSLREMWQLRSLRSDEWGMVLNFLQIALAEEVLEGFDASKCDAIRVIIEKHLSPAANREDVDSCLEILEEVGLDPWKMMASYRE